MFANSDNKALCLRKSAGEGDIKGCMEILEKFPDLINCVGTESKRSALHNAALYNHVEVVRYLVAKGAISTIDSKGYTPYDLTTTPEIRRVLHYDGRGVLYNLNPKITENEYFHYGYNLDKNRILADLNKISSITEFQKFLIEYNLNVNSFVDGCQLLDMINFNYHFYEELCSYLLKNGANPNIKANYHNYDAYENTPLHSLLAHEFTNRAKYFISIASTTSQKPLDCRVQDIEGKTSLILASLLRNAEIAHLLLSRFGTAAIDMQDKKGRTALHYAYLFGSKKTIKVLINFGANQDIIDNYGNTPKDMLTIGVEEIKKVLLSFHIDPNRDINYDLELECGIKDPLIGSHNYSRKNNISIYKSCIQDRLEIMQENYIENEAAVIIPSL